MGEGTAVALPGRANVVRALLIVCGGVPLAAALLCNRSTLAPLASGAASLLPGGQGARGARGAPGT